MSTNETERDDSASTESPEATSSPTEESQAPAAAEGASPVGAEGASSEYETDSSDSAAAEPAEAASTPAEPAAIEASTSTDANAAAAAPKAASAGSSKAGAPTPGQRIAAQKAAKAAQKAAEKARRAEDAAAAASADTAEEIPGAAVPSAPDELELRTAEVRAAVVKNTNNLAKLGAAVLAGVLIFAGVNMVLQHRARAAGTLLARAVDASRAQIGSNEGQTDGRLRFGSEAARDREAISRYRKVIAEYPSSEAARFARLGIARLLMTQQKYAEAQVEIRAASSGLEDSPSLEALVAQASALAYTGERKFAEAQQAIDRLGRLDRQRYRDVADYLSARVLFDRGDREGAKAKLRALLDRLDDEGAVPHDHVEDQARNLMRQIDPSALPAESPGQISPELLQMLLRQQGLGGGGQ